MDIIIIDDFERDPHDLLAELKKLHEEIQDAFSFWYGVEINGVNVHDFHEATRDTIDKVKRVNVLEFFLLQHLRQSHQDIHAFLRGMN